jgi:hypothetical protein
MLRGKAREEYDLCKQLFLDLDIYSRYPNDCRILRATMYYYFKGRSFRASKELIELMTGHDYEQQP